MRDDAVGLFWQDLKPSDRPKIEVIRNQPQIPATGWEPVKSFWDFPRLDAAPWVSIDCETYDPGLLERGPGWARGEGHVVGISVAVPERSWYMPMRHEVQPEQNLKPEQVIEWAKYYLANKTQPKIGANLLYDVGWLSEEGIKVAGKCYDVQFAEALLDESAKVNLQDLGVKYLNRGKESNILYQWLADYYGGKPDEKQRANIYRAPPCLVGPYAESDAVMPGQILPLQWAALIRDGLVPVFEMETDLIHLLIAMRRAGVAVDIPRAEQARDKLAEHIAGLEAQMRHIVGFDVNVDANESIQKAFQKLGLPIPLHWETGQPTFTKDSLPLIEHPFADLIIDIRKQTKVKRDFIESAILEKHTNGKLFPLFHPLRGDEDGTRSGRFSGTKPNLQQVPSRDEILAAIVRGIFWPDIGHKQWRRYDYNQIEYRFLAHYAVGPGSDELRAQYNRDPKTDFHIFAQKLVTDYTSLVIPRKPIKNFNFGMTFGMGRDKMVRTTTTELKKLGGEFKLDGDQLYEAYHEALPFSRATLDHYSQLAINTGQVRTILGRISRFDLWEPDTRVRKGEKRGVALPYDQAVRLYGSRIKRAYGHKALNRVLQGSGTGDLIKMAMLKCWQSGVFDVVGVPRLTVHDELDFSDAGGNDEAWAYVQHTLEHAIPLRIPVIAALELGANWGDAT